MLIGGMQKLTLLDYPGVLSCIVFTAGCNFRCPFCHNGELVVDTDDIELTKEEELFAYLKKRKNVLDGVVVSGGEPLIHKDIEDLIRKIKDLGYKVKLDTNGSNPDKLKDLIDKKLIDYVAMDIKMPLKKYETITKVKINTDLIKKSIDILMSSGIPHEFRTTIVKEFHTHSHIKEICKMIGKDELYYLQNYKDSDGVIEKGLHSFSEDELSDMIKDINKDYPRVSIR